MPSVTFCFIGSDTTDLNSFFIKTVFWDKKRDLKSNLSGRQFLIWTVSSSIPLQTKVKIAF
jgi:hypothetical protein